MQPASEAPDLIGLLAETRAALAHLRADELDALALRAEEILISCANLNQPSPTLLREHSLLRDLLSATGENLRVLRRARNTAEGGPRWAL